MTYMQDKKERKGKKERKEIDRRNKGILFSVMDS